MISRLNAFRSPAILGVHVYAQPARSVLVVTENPAIVNAVKVLLKPTLGNISTIWMPSVASACQRSERDRPEMVIICGGDNEAESLELLRNAAPQARIVVLN